MNIKGMATIQKITYDDIVRKLGFNPKTYIPCKHKFHDDNYESPFNILTAEETRFLLNYLKVDKAL